MTINPYPEFELTIDVKDIKQIVESANTLTEDLEIKVTNDGLRSAFMDPQHVALINIDLGSNIFEKFSVTKEGSFIIILEQFKKILNELDSKDTIKLKMYQDKQTLFLLDSYHDKINKVHYSEYKIQIKEPIENNTPIPKLTYNSSIHIKESLSDWKNQLSKMNKFGDYIKIETTTDQKEITAITEKDHNDLKVDLPFEDLQVKENTTSTYTLEYLESFLKTVQKERSIILNYTSKMPLKLSVVMQYSGSTFDYYLAPRVES